MNKGRIEVNLLNLTMSGTWFTVGQQIAERISTALDVECECLTGRMATSSEDEVIITIPLFSDQSNIIPCLAIDRAGAIGSAGANIYVGLWRSDGYGHQTLIRLGVTCRAGSGDDQYDLVGLRLKQDGSWESTQESSFYYLTGLVFDSRYIDSNGFVSVSCYQSGSNYYRSYSGTYFIRAKHKLNNTYHPILLIMDKSFYNATNSTGKSFTVGLNLTDQEYYDTTNIFNETMAGGGLVLHKILNQMYEVEDMFILSSNQSAQIKDYALVNGGDDFRDGIIMPDGTHYYVTRRLRPGSGYSTTLLAFKKFD